MPVTWCISARGATLTVDLAIDAAADGDGLVWLDGAEAVQIDGEVGPFDGRDVDGDGQRRRRGRCLSVIKMTPTEIAADRDQDDKSRPRPSAPKRWPVSWGHTRVLIYPRVNVSRR
jgi:hypothetical protein